MASLAYNKLTHGARDKMDTISQTTFLKCILLNENVLIPIKISLKFIGSDNALSPTRG